MLSDEEKVVLERCRVGPAGLARAAASLLLDRDAAHAQIDLLVEEETLRSDFHRTMPPEPHRFGFSPCDVAMLASIDVLAHAPADRKLEELTIAFDPAVTNVTWTGCDPHEVDPALALVSWLIGDEALAARYLVRSRPAAILDRLLTEVISVLVRDRGNEVNEVLTRLGPDYRAAMEEGLWRFDPYAFLHVRLLATLRVAAERNRLDLTTLSDSIPYVPIWFVSSLLEEQTGL